MSATTNADLDALAGLDALDTPLHASSTRLQRAWAATWPRLTAAAVLIGLWQVVVWSGWRPPWVLPGPVPVLRELWAGAVDGSLPVATLTTLSRATVGFAAAIAVGTCLGIAVASSRTLRTAVGSAITAVQTMPSIAWFPLAILVFGLTEQAILFVVVLGAAPSVANGFVHGVDHVPPLLLRAGRVLGARGLAALRFIVLPAAMPGYVAGLKQGWAFSWRSLMAGELLVVIANRPSLGVRLQFAREASDAAMLLATMLAILAIGLVVDALVFARLDAAVRRRWGLASA